jgi:hypothetical protein
MPEPDLIELFVHPFDALGIKYLVSGSVASTLYGEPRVTHDVDLIVFLRHEDVSRLAQVYREPQFYLPPIEVILQEIIRERGGHFNIVHINSGLKADIYLAGREQLHGWALRNKKHYEIRGRTITVAPPEYVIVRKLEYYRAGGSQKHLRDIRSMLAVSGNEVNRTALEEWVTTLGLQPEWRQVSS